MFAARETIEAIFDWRFVGRRAQLDRREPLRSLGSKSIVNREIAAGPYEFVNELRLRHELAIGVDVEDGFFMGGKLMADEIGLGIRKIVGSSNADRAVNGGHLVYGVGQPKFLARRNQAFCLWEI